MSYYTLFAIVLVIWFVVIPHLMRPAPPVGVTIGGVLLLIVVAIADLNDWQIILNF